MEYMNRTKQFKDVGMVVPKIREAKCSMQMKAGDDDLKV